MITRKPLLRATAVSALAGIISLVAQTTFAQTPEPPGLFSKLPMNSRAVLPQQAIAGKSRAVKINHGRLRSGRFFVSLPGGVSYEAVVESQEDLGKGRSSWVGHASGDSKNTVVISISGDAVAGTFTYRDKLFKLEPRKNGSHVLSEVKTTSPAPELDPIPVADTTSNDSDLPGSGSISADSNGSVLDVLVAYTPAIQALYGTQGAEALALQAVAEANQAYASSGMATRLNLVHSVLTDYAESSSMNTDLSRLRSTNDGYMDELHALRNSYGADLVSLIENEPQYCGLAYRMATLSSSFASSAFSVVHHSCATGYFSFAHEIGHNQGAHHDTANASGAIFSYAYGYQDSNNSFRTVMAYNCPGGCTRVSRFSNSNLTYNGLPTGYADYTENAYTIDSTASTVAAFRQAATQGPPSAPSSLSSTTFSATQTELNWTDMSVDESGFLLERSTDGFNFTQFVSVPANSTYFQDNDLDANTTYNYRIRSWNSSGNSGYSNVATATTEAAPQFVEQLVTAQFSGNGSVSGTFQDTWYSGDAYQSITESQGNSSIKKPFLEHYWSIQVQPGKTVTLHADVGTDGSSTESFTFAYTTTFSSVIENPEVWVDMFTVSDQNPGARQFTLPASLSGGVLISVRDNERVGGTSKQNTINIDYLSIRTVTNSGENPIPLPPGC